MSCAICARGFRRSATAAERGKDLFNLLFLEDLENLDGDIQILNFRQKRPMSSGGALWGFRSALIQCWS